MASRWLNLGLLRLRRPKAPAPRRAQEYREAFRRFDADGDGKISSSELQSFFAWSGDNVSAEEVQMAVRDYDSDGDGLMDYGDFVRLMEVGGEREEEDDLKRAFAMFESEKGSGRITPAGLQQVLGRLGDVRTQEECAAMIRAYDVDGDGVLDYQEFHRMMAS